MSGHSKWATIKHKKAANDKARAKVFAKVLRQVEVAAREGGGDPETNPTLRTMYQKARDNSIPMDTIDRAVKRGTGDLDGVTYSQITYEGYAPGSVAVMVEVLTDNRNRAGAEVRNVFTRNGGSTSEPGAVAWQFDRKGQIIVNRSAEEEELMLTALDAGAEDIVDDGDTWRIVTPPTGAARGAQRARRGRAAGGGGRPDDGAAVDGAAGHGRERQEGTAADRRSRRARRRPGGARQLRHPRRDPRNRGGRVSEHDVPEAGR